jgi:uncharacterized protein (DUF983 family)
MGGERVMDVLGTISEPSELPAVQLVFETACPRCGSTRTELVAGGFTVRVTRCSACEHKWIAHRLSDRVEICRPAS